MRTTLSIDDDVLAAARAIAEREDETLGAVVSGLLRKALRPDTPVLETRNGVPLLPRTGERRPVTLEMVNALRDELP